MRRRKELGERFEVATLEDLAAAEGELLYWALVRLGPPTRLRRRASGVACVQGSPRPGARPACQHHEDSGVPEPRGRHCGDARQIDILIERRTGAIGRERGPRGYDSLRRSRRRPAARAAPGWSALTTIEQPAMCDARGVIPRVTRHALDDDDHSVQRRARLVCRERRTRPELVGAIVHDDELAPVTIDEHAIFQRHARIGSRLPRR
jgi:hypothetical protein